MIATKLCKIVGKPYLVLLLFSDESVHSALSNQETDWLNIVLVHSILSKADRMHQKPMHKFCFEKSGKTDELMV